MRCRMCHCTDHRACPGGCSWAEEGLCSVCDDFMEWIDLYIQEAHQVTRSSVTRMLVEVQRKRRVAAKAKAAAHVL